MDQVSFGTVLQDARMRKGYDLATAARRLRIRPDILQAIEAADFSRMPPRGYARNMVNAYARYLGLNPTEVTRMYLDEAYAYQVGRARSDARQTGFDMSGASGARRGGRRDYDEQSGTSALGRKLYVDDPHGDRRRIEGDRADRHGEDRTHRSSRSALPNAQYTNFYSGPKASPIANSKLPFIIAGAVIIILLIIVLVLVFGQGGSNNEDTPKMPVSGLTDPEDSGTTNEGGDSGDTQTPTPAKVAPAKTVFKYEVGNGSEVYIEVYDVADDGTETWRDGGTITGPASNEFDVTKKLKFTTVNPDAVKVYQDGEEVKLTDPNGNGVYQVIIDFASVLQKWQEENGSASASGASDANGSDAADANGAGTPDSNDGGDGDGSAAA